MNKYRVEYSYKRNNGSEGFRSTVIEAESICHLIYYLYEYVSPSKACIKIYKIMLLP